MIRSLVVALLLLGSVGSASAECAWVLWSGIEIYSSGKSGKSLTPDTAVETKSECEKGTPGPLAEHP
jgi:hypothetical protein